MSDIALIGKKLGMSREFYKTGQSVPVTVLKMETGRGVDSGTIQYIGDNYHLLATEDGDSK